MLVGGPSFTSSGFPGELSLAVSTGTTTQFYTHSPLILHHARVCAVGPLLLTAVHMVIDLTWSGTDIQGPHGRTALGVLNIAALLESEALSQAAIHRVLQDTSLVLPSQLTLSSNNWNSHAT